MRQFVGLLCFYVIESDFINIKQHKFQNLIKKTLKIVDN